MVQIHAQPNVIVGKLAPSDSFTTEIIIEHAPGDRAAVARIESGNDVARVIRMVTFREIRVPYTEEEIAELPPHPPSIREKARREGRIEQVESSSVSEGSALPVAVGAQVMVSIEVTSPAKSGRINKATLVLSGEAWERTEIPIVAITGTSGADAMFFPDRIVSAVIPGAIRRDTITVPTAPSAAMAVALLDPASPHIRIASVTAFRAERREFTSEELQELPEALREQMKREGYVVHIETASVPANTEIAVPFGGQLQVTVETTAPVSGETDWAGSTVRIEATTWRRISANLSYIFGNVIPSLSAESIVVRQGQESDPITLNLASTGGPDTDVTLQLGAAGEPWHVVPSVVRVRRRHSTTAELRVVAAASAPLGEHHSQITASWFDGRASQVMPLLVSVRPGGLSVVTLQRTPGGAQGDSVLVPIRIESKGGYKKVQFEAGLMPRGVRVEPLSWERNGAAIEVVNLRFSIAPDAPAHGAQRTTINWVSADGENSGSLELRFTVWLKPETKVFGQSIVTPSGTALGGHAELVLSNDGTGRFRGHMRATGLPSYSFRVRAVMRSSDGRIAAVAQKTGRVHGTLDAGDRQLNWDEVADSRFTRSQWPAVRAGQLVVSKSYELSGILGTAVGVFNDLLEFVSVSAILTPVVPGASALVGLVFLGSELGSLAGVRVVGPGGLVGLTVAGGALILVGPQVLIPVFVGGVALGSALVNHRPMLPAEQDVARRVFRDTLPFERILLTNLSGERGQAFVAPNVDGQILVNLGNAFELERPMRNEQLLIHELTHAWQIARNTFATEIIWDALIDRLGGSSSYDYGPPGPRWAEGFSLEAQASVVEEWFAGTDRRAIVKMPGREPESENDPYFPYIENNIRLGQA